jgi:molecular chaperone GrpE
MSEETPDNVGQPEAASGPVESAPQEAGTGAGQGGGELPRDPEALARLVVECRRELEALRKALAERDEKIDLLMRGAAELDNRRKRVERQMEEHSRYALQSLAVGLLPVIDNFERALGHAEERRDFDALYDGLKLVHDQLIAVLKKHHVEKVEALGRPFDPLHHEAVGQMGSEEHPDETVIDVHQAGYRLHDRVIRPSKVIISRRAKPGGEKDKAPPDQGRAGQGEADA